MERRPRRSCQEATKGSGAGSVMSVFWVGVKTPSYRPMLGEKTAQTGSARPLARVFPLRAWTPMRPARASWTGLCDPAIVVQDGILVPGGTVAAAGTRIELRAHRPLRQVILFIDGSRTVEFECAPAEQAPVLDARFRAQAPQ